MKAHLQDIPAKSSSDEVLLNDGAYANPTLTFVDIAIMRFAIFLHAFVSIQIVVEYLMTI